VNRRRLAGLSTSIGIAIGGLGAAFVLRALTREWSAVRAAMQTANVLPLAAGLLCGLAGMTGIGLAWRHAMRLVGLPYRPAMHSYFVGQLGKYVPGGIWPVVGRSEMARRAGSSRAVAYWSTVLSLGATYLGALLVVALLLPLDLSRARSATVLWVLTLLPAGLLALHPAIVERALHLAQKVSRQQVTIQVPTWGQSTMLVARHVPSWLLISTATWLVARAFTPSPDLANVYFATTLSWVVGFITVPVPGGIGVREAVFTTAATSLPPGIAATTAVTARLVFILVDSLGAGVSAAVVGRRFLRRAAAPEPTPSSGSISGRS